MVSGRVRLEGSGTQPPVEVRVARRPAAPSNAFGFDLRTPASHSAIVVPGDDGGYTIDLPDEGPWILEARTERHAGPVRVVRAPAVADFVLSPIRETTVTVVEWPDGNAVAGADVYVAPDEYGVAPRLHAITDSAGVARLATTGAEEVLVVAPGFAPLRQFADAGDLVVRLQSGYSIAGLVCGQNGAPVAGAVLRFDDGAEEGPVAADASVRRWTTDDAGRFVVDGVRAGAGDGVAFVVSAPGHPTTTASLMPGDAHCVVRLAAEVPVIDFPPKRATSSTSYLTVRLVDADGETVSNVQAQLVGVIADGGGDADGVRTFTVSQPPGTQVGVAFFRPGSGGDGPRKLMEGAAETSKTRDAHAVEFRLPKLSEVTVEVRAAGDIDLLDRDVCIELVDRWSCQKRRGIGADALAATFSVDAARPMVAKVSTPGIATVERVLAESEDKAGRAVMTVTAGATVRGRLLGASPAVAEFVEVRIVSAASRSSSISFVAQVPTDEGAFEFERLAPGQWHIDVFWPAGCVARSLDVSVPEGATSVDLGVLKLPTIVRVRGVVESDSGQPVGGAVADFQASSAQAWEVSTPVRADGTFELFLPVTARGTVIVRRRGLGAALADLDASTGSRVALRLPREGRLDVRLRLPSSHRRSSFWWGVRTVDGTASWQPEGDSEVDFPGFDARFVWRGLGPGPIVVQVTGPGWRLERSVVVVAGETTEVVLEE